MATIRKTSHVSVHVVSTPSTGKVSMKVWVLGDDGAWAVRGAVLAGAVPTEQDVESLVALTTGVIQAELERHLGVQLSLF